MHILVRVLLILLSLPLLLFIVMAPLAAFKNIGVFATFILFGSVGVILASMAILTPRDKVPDQTLTGIPDDSDLPKGGIATRFWQGLFGNIPAAIVIDTNQHNILFVSCLGHHGSTGSRKPHVLLGKKDIDGVYEIISRSKSGFQEVSLHKIGRAHV